VHLLPIQAKHIKQTLSLIQELARYEGLEHLLEVDETRLQELMFGPSPIIFGLMAWDRRTPIGLATYYYNASTFAGTRGLFIEDIFVLESHRRLGIGKALFERIIEIARTGNCGRVEWLALDWNTSALDFYQKMGAIIQPDWRRMRLPLSTTERIHNPA